MDHDARSTRAEIGSARPSDDARASPGKRTLTGALPPVQRAPAAAAAPDGAARAAEPPADAPASEGGAPHLTAAQLARARRENTRYWHTLHFDERVFADARPDTDEFAHAVARYQASTGGALPVDGIAAPETCQQRGCAIDPAAAGGTQAVAARGLEGAGGPLPHADRIKASFGDKAPIVDGIDAHVGGAAADAATEIDAQAYAMGDGVGFRSPPDLHTAAHEAAHVVQQQQGVHPKGGVGEDGDPLERHADAVADAVVRGEPAQPLLDHLPAGGGGAGRAVQRLRFDANGNLAPGGVVDTTNQDAFRQAVEAPAAQTPQGRVVLTRVRDALRQVRDAHDGRFTHHDAIALSRVERALDVGPQPLLPAGVPLGQATFAHLPRRERWRMFIDPAQQANGPLAFDTQSSPGYYAAMMRAFDRFFDPAALGQQVNAGTYNQMHDMVTDGAFTRHGGGFQNLPQTWSLGGAMATSYPMAIGGQHQINPAALGELRNEGIARPHADQHLGNVPAALHGAFQQGAGPALAAGQQPPATPVNYRYEDGRPQGGIERVGVYTNYQPGAAQAFTQQRLTAYYQEVGGIAAALQALTLAQLGQEVGQISPGDAIGLHNNAAHRPQCEALCRRRRIVTAIARIVRTLHVGHVFPDANGRLNTMLLLNRLLIEQGLSPSIVADTSVFGGRASLAQLIADIEGGQNTFQNLVQQTNPMPFAAPAPVVAPPAAAAMPPPAAAAAQGPVAMDTT